MTQPEDKSTDFSKTSAIRCGEKTLSFEQPRIMGILNLTPDSFYDGGKFPTLESCVLQAGEMLSQGADIIDLGAVSTRPGAAEVTEEEELKRLLPVLEVLLQRYPEAIFSIDTFRSKVAKQAAGLGKVIINDISAGNLDPEMAETVAEAGLPYVAMHMQGTPANMQMDPRYMDVVAEIDAFFSVKIQELRQKGVNQIILDPGFGFGKALRHNYQLLFHLSEFRKHGLPLMVGVSRKSMITKLLQIPAAEALNATTAVNTLALLQGADILRVHDVKEAVEAMKVVEAFREQNYG